MLYNDMNKAQLRSACVNAGILEIDGLSVAEMRELLNARAPQEGIEAPGFDTPAAIETATGSEPEPEAQVVTEAPVAPVVPAVIVPVPVVRVARAESNGVKQPAPGTICRQIWDHCDAVLALGQMPQAKAVRAWGAGKLDDVTMTVQFYRWRKYNGISGRQA